mgnify:CR=1 FL=1
MLFPPLVAELLRSVRVFSCFLWKQPLFTRGQGTMEVLSSILQNTLAADNAVRHAAEERLFEVRPERGHGVPFLDALAACKGCTCNQISVQ